MQQNHDRCHTQNLPFSYKDHIEPNNGGYVCIVILALVFSLLSFMISTNINLSIFQFDRFYEIVCKWALVK